MRRLAHVVIACAALLFAAFPPGFAAGSPLGGKTVCLLPLVDLTPDGTLGDYADVITEDLGVQLQQEGVLMVTAARVRETIATRKAAPRDLLTPRAASSAALAAGGDIAVNGFIALEGDTLKVSLRAYDARSGVLLAGLLRDLEFNISLYAFLWQAVSDMLAQAVPAPSATVPDGTPAAAAARPARAELPAPVNPPEGRPASGTLAPRPRVRPTGFAVEADWTAGQLLGAGSAFRLYLAPDYLFLSPTVYVSEQPAFSSGGSTLTHLDAGLLVGQYLFFRPESPFRLGLSAGGGAIFSWTPVTGAPVFFDPYVDIVNLWVELNLPWVSLSLRSDLRYALGGPSPNLLGQGVILWAGFLPPISLGVAFKW